MIEGGSKIDKKRKSNAHCNQKATITGVKGEQERQVFCLNTYFPLD